MIEIKDKNSNGEKPPGDLTAFSFVEKFSLLCELRFTILFCPLRKGLNQIGPYVSFGIKPSI